MTPPAPANTGEVQTGREHSNRRRKPDPVRSILIASVVSLALGAIAWAASTTASTLKEHQKQIDAHEKEDASKWGQNDAKIDYLVEGMREFRETTKEYRASSRDMREAARALREAAEIRTTKTKPR